MWTKIPERNEGSHHGQERYERADPRHPSPEGERPEPSGRYPFAPLPGSGRLICALLAQHKDLCLSWAAVGRNNVPDDLVIRRENGFCWKYRERPNLEITR